MQQRQNFDPFEQEIINTLENITEEIDSSEGNKVWTIQIKKMLKAIVDSQKSNYKCACHSIDGTDWGEWLYDFVSYSCDANGMTDVHLVVECEWKSPIDASDYRWEIQCDFEKLIQARCQYRLMIFEVSNEAVAVEYVEHLCRIAQKFKFSLPTDRYVVAVWNCETDSFLFYQYSPKHL